MSFFLLKGTSIKQADAILLGFPLNQKMERDVRYSDLQIYKPVTDSDGPAMSWAMFSIGYGDVGSFQERDEMFQRSQKNTQQPFHVSSCMLYSGLMEVAF